MTTYLESWPKELYMSIQEIINELQSIEYQLDSAADGNSSLDGARSDLNELKHKLETELIQFGGDYGVDADYEIEGC